MARARVGKQDIIVGEPSTAQGRSVKNPAVRTPARDAQEPARRLLASTIARMFSSNFAASAFSGSRPSTCLT